MRASSFSRKLFTVHCSLFTDRGFTLIETIVVMIVIAILAAVIVMRSPFDSIKLASATKKVAGDIRYAQKLAISNQTRAGITFSLNGYSVYQNITVPTPAISPGDSCSTDASNNFVVDFTAPRCSNYSNVQITPPLTNPIAFNSLGTPVNQWGTIIGSQTVTLSLSGVSDETITITAGTGRVSF